MISSTIAGSVSTESRDLPAQEKTAIRRKQHIPGGASSHDLKVARPHERLKNPTDLELREREPETEVLTDAEPNVPAGGWVASLDIEEVRRWEDAVILRGVVHENEDTLALVKAMARDDHALRDAAKREWRRHDQPKGLVDGPLHELRLRTKPTHLPRIQEDSDDAG
jgi:hypothetical protein